ncbi:TPA: hypothetical protein PJM11_000421 [Escherichia coli]|nr:hypothetical protein [Escherichia coli]
MQKTIIGITVGSFCGFPTPQTEPQYLGAGKPDPEVRKLREEAKARVLTELESLLQSPVISQWGMAIDVTRTDRRGRYLPRPV